MWWFDSWTSVLRVIAVGGATYVALVLMLRMSGKRTLSKLNAFDLVVTVAMGSILATTLLTKDVAFAEAVAALAVLCAAQYLIAWLSVRSRRFAGWVRSEPRLLLLRGQLLHDALRVERITPQEVSASIRSQGLSRLEDAGAVILETDGSMTVLPAPVAERSHVLKDVQGTGEGSDLPKS